MQDMLNIRTLLRQEGGPAKGEAVFDFSGRDFLGFAVPGPVNFSWQAEPNGDAVRLQLCVDAAIEAECVRCLEPFKRQEKIEKTYDIRMEDLEGEFPEYPTALDGSLDLEELAYGELVLEVSPILVCSEDCQGLCSACGKPKGQCACPEVAAGDPRWQALRDLLEEDETKATDE